MRLNCESNTVFGVGEKGGEAVWEIVIRGREKEQEQKNFYSVKWLLLFFTWKSKVEVNISRLILDPRL